MKKKKKYLINIFLLIIIITGYFFLDKILTFLSPDRFVKKLIVFKKMYIVFGLIIFILSNFILFIEQTRKYLFGCFKNLASYCHKKKKHIYFLTIIFLFFYILISSLFIINRLDVSTDESTYVSTFRNYISNNNLVYTKQEGAFSIPKDMFGQNIVLIIFSSLIKNPITGPRYITFAYSVILLLLLGFYFYNNYKEKGLLFFIMLYASYPGFIYLTGSGFGENISVLLGITGLYLWNSSRSSQKFKTLKYFTGAAFTATAIMTKLQFGVFLIFSFVTIIFLKLLFKKNILIELKFCISFVILFILFYFIYLFGFYDKAHINILLKNLYITNLTLGTGGMKDIFYYLESINKFFNFQNIILVPILLYYLIKNKSSLPYFMLLITLIIFFNFLWYFNKNYCFRFMYFANFGLLLIGIIGILQLMKKGYSLKYFIYFLLLFNLSTGIISNIIFSLNGVSNEYQLYLNGELALKSKINIERYKNQTIFYSTINKIVKSSDTVYFVNFEDEMAAFSNHEYKYFTINTFLKEGDYIVVPSFYYLTDSKLLDQIKYKLETVYELDNYKLYRVK